MIYIIVLVKSLRLLEEQEFIKMTKITVTTVVAELKKDIEYIREDLKLNRSEHKEIIVAIEGLSNKYAGKWIEKVSIAGIIGMVGIIIKIVFGA